MAIAWGGFVNHIRVGIEVTNDGYSTYTPTINVYVKVFVQVDSTWNFSDNQHVSLYGSGVSGEYDFFNNMGRNEVRQIGGATIYNQGQSYGGGPYYEFGATLSGNYLGANSSVVVGYTLPARPIRPPTPPAWPPAASAITTTSVYVDWGGSADHGGSGPTAGHLQLSLNPNFTQVIYGQDGATYSRDVGGLQPATTYYMRALFRSVAGDSGWSATGSFGTIGNNVTQAPVASNVSSSSADISWAFPASGGTPDTYTLQVARDPGFSQIVVDRYAGWTQNFLVTDLPQNTIFYTRVRAGKVVWGPWSPTSSFKTLTGAKVQRNGQWVNATPYARVNGVWQPVSVFKRVGGAWRG